MRIVRASMAWANTSGARSNPPAHLRRAVQRQSVRIPSLVICGPSTQTPFHAAAISWAKRRARRRPAFEKHPHAIPGRERNARISIKQSKCIIVARNHHWPARKPEFIRSHSGPVYMYAHMRGEHGIERIDAARAKAHRGERPIAVKRIEERRGIGR